MPVAQTATSHIHYSITGTGAQTVLLIMGLGGHATEWGEPFLSGLREHYRVVAMDNRGIGESLTSVPSWTLADMAQDASAVLDAISCERALVVGTSMGGMIAQRLALAAPARVAKLVLMSTSFGGAESIPPAPEASVLFAPMPGLSAGEVQRQSLSALTSPSFVQTHAALLEDLVAQRERVRTRARVFQAQLHALLSDDRAQLVREIRVPTLVMHGRGDILIPVGNGQLLAERIPGAELVLLDDCGHLPHLEKTSECLDVLRRFFG